MLKYAGTPQTEWGVDSAAKRAASTTNLLEITLEAAPDIVLQTLYTDIHQAHPDACANSTLFQPSRCTRNCKKLRRLGFQLGIQGPLPHEAGGGGGGGGGIANNSHSRATPTSAPAPASAPHATAENELPGWKSRVGT